MCNCSFDLCNLEDGDVLPVDHDVDHGVVEEGGQQPAQHHQEQQEVEDAEAVGAASVASVALPTGVFSNNYNVQHEMVADSFYIKCYFFCLTRWRAKGLNSGQLSEIGSNANM